MFNAEQADGLPARLKPTAEPLWKVHQNAERVLEDSGVPVRHMAGDRAFYNLNRDEIVLPERGQFPSANHYYQTALHELGHSTGHPERMNRATLTQGMNDGFGSPAYAKEELRAEISAMMTGERVGVGHDPSRGAAYVEGWIAALEEDPREIRRAAADAQKISDFVLARHREREAVREPAAVAATRAAAPLTRGGGAEEMFDRTIEPDPRPAAPPSRANQRMRNGHRREHAASRDRGSISFPERCARGLADIGVYGAVSYRDLAETRFGGHPYTTRRAVNAWICHGLAQETRATGPGGNPFKVLTLTSKGMAEARKRAGEQGMDPGQEIRFARIRPSEAAHDIAVYRACGKEHQRLLEQGATVRRIHLDSELKGTVARGSEAARVKDGQRAADAERHRIAEDLELPVDDGGRVLYPDAQIEYTDADGRSGRVNIEVASGNYREGAIRAKAAAGFSLHANGPAAARLLRTLSLGGGDDGSSLRGPADRDPAAVEL